MEAAFVIFFIIIVFVILLAIFGVFSTSPPPKNTKPTRVSSKTPPPSDGLDALFTVLAVGAAGFVAYQVIKAITQEVGKMPININGQYQSIATASKNNSFINELLREIVQKKVGDGSSIRNGLNDPSNNPHKAAEDIAQMLRDAVEARMRSRGL